MTSQHSDDPSRPIDEEVAEVLALDEKRSPGEWFTAVDGRQVFVKFLGGDVRIGLVPYEDSLGDSLSEEDAAFIAAAPRMAALIRRMAEERKEVIDTLQFYAGASRNTYALEGGKRALELMVKMLVHDDGDGPPEAQPQQQEKT